jgi:2-polyprenyl-3-methyl-5-hydroxy-6-metoxy-1,4-benzoquinol methylase
MSKQTCIVCQSTISKKDTFIVNQRLRGYVEWHQCLACRSYFTYPQSASDESHLVQQNLWGMRNEGIQLGKDKEVMFVAALDLHHQFRKNNGRKILDIGASYGGFTSIAVKLGFDVYAFDIFEDAVNYLNEIGAKATLSHHIDEYIKKSGQNQFDAIFALDCICYWQNIQHEFEKIYEILAAQGTFIIRNPDKAWSISLGRKTGIDALISKSVHDHTSSIPLKSMIQLLEKSGFKIEKVQFESAIPNKLHGWVTRLMYKFGGIFWPWFHFSPGYYIVVSKK